MGLSELILSHLPNLQRLYAFIGTLTTHTLSSRFILCIFLNELYSFLASYSSLLLLGHLDKDVYETNSYLMSFMNRSTQSIFSILTEINQFANEQA